MELWVKNCYQKYYYIFKTIIALCQVNADPLQQQEMLPLPFLDLGTNKEIAFIFYLFSKIRAVCL